MYSPSELQQLQRQGKAHRLATGAIIPTNTPADVAAAIQQAKNAHRTGGDDDEAAFRRHLIGRAAAHGVRQLIPASWAAERAGKSAALSEIYQFDVTRVDAVARPANGVGTLLMKSAAAPAPGRRVTVEYDAPALETLGKASSLNAGLTELARQGRLGELQQDIARTAKAIAASIEEPLAKAAEYERTAEAMADRATAAAYRDAARRAREQVTTPAGHLAKAEKYERLAQQVADPVASRDYRELARRARQEAGLA